MADMNVKGGYFAPDNYLKVNEGGSHDENPNGGVQIGMDQNGVPNMLEEGEPVYNDFVYSDNIVADEEFLEKHDLPKKYKGWLYSKIADDLFEEYSENPLDPISKNGADIMLTRLAECQEEQKLAAEQAQLEEMLASLSPEERDALAQAMIEQQQPAPQYMAMMPQEAAPQEPVPMEGMPMEASPEQMALPGQPMMAACGGHISRNFDEGGFRGDDNWLQKLWHSQMPSQAFTSLPANTLPGAFLNSYYNGIKGGDVTYGDAARLGLDLGTFMTSGVPAGSLADALVEGDKKRTAGLIALSLLAPGSARVGEELGFIGGLRPNWMVKAGKGISNAAKAVGKGFKKIVTEPIGKIGEAWKGAIGESAYNTALRRAARGDLIKDKNAIIRTGRNLRMSGVLDGNYQDLVNQSNELVGKIWSNRLQGVLPYIGNKASNLLPGYQFMKNSVVNPGTVGVGRTIGAVGQNLIPGAITYGAIKGLSEREPKIPSSGIPAPPEWGNYEDNGGKINMFAGPYGSSQIQRVNPGYNMGLVPNDGGFFDTYTRGIGGGHWYHSLRPNGTTGASIVGSTPGLAASAGPRHQAQVNNTAAPVQTVNAPVAAINPAGLMLEPTDERMLAFAKNAAYQNYTSPGLVDSRLTDKSNAARQAYYANNSVDENPVVASSENGRRLLSTIGKDLVPIAEGAIGLADIAQSPDQIIAERMQPRMISGNMRLIDQRYNPIDVNQTVNTVTNQNNATARALRNSGNPVSTQAALIAADVVGNRNIGEAIAQNKLANEQLYNNAIAGYNNNESARAQFDLGVDRYNQAVDADAQRYNSQLGFNTQYINNQYDTQKWQAVSNQIQRGLDALYANAISNHNANMVITNPANEGYVIAPNGAIGYYPTRYSSNNTQASVPVTTYGAKIQPSIPSYYDSRYMPDYSQQFAENAEKIRKKSGLMKSGGKLKK